MVAESSVRSIQFTPRHAVWVTPVYDTYWKFAAKRQELFCRRVEGSPPPWTDDHIIQEHRFTNAYRAADRVSQYLIRNVIYSGSQSADEIVFRVLLFKFFNKIETWERLVKAIGMPSWATFKFDRYSKPLDDALAEKIAIYSAAYIMPSPAFGNVRKHQNHLQLLEHMMRQRLPEQLESADALERVFAVIRTYPSMGDFLAFQYAIDLNYSELLDFSEMDFVVAGPGAINGISKCFADTGGLSNADLIRAMADRASEEFARLGLTFHDLWGRPLQLIDCQNLFCEVDKYSRVAHPEFAGDSGRTRIKQRFVPNDRALPQWYPPKWNLTPPMTRQLVGTTTERQPRRAVQLSLAFGT